MSGKVRGWGRLQFLEGPSREGHSIDAAPTSNARSVAVLVAALFAARAPFLWTGHVQEDAYITFRTAFNLADHGQLSFNLGEHYAAVTSLLYAYVGALVRALASSHAVGVILVINAVVAALAVVRLSRVFSLSGARARYFVGVLGLSSGALLPAFNGMETAWCLLYVSLLCEHVGPTRIRPALYALLLMLGALIRPDAVFFSASAWALRAAFGGARDRPRTLWGGVGLALGVSAWAALNRLHSGTWLAPSITAKQAAYHPAFSIGSVLQRLSAVYLEGPLSLLPASKYIPLWLVAGASVLMLSALGTSVARARDERASAELPRLLFLTITAALFPLLLAIGGALFPWYFYPSAFALAAGLLVALDRRPPGGGRRALMWLGASLSISGYAAQFLISINVGRQESGYRAGVGRYLATVASPGDTLVLEPAGYIPYFSGLITYDEVGLASPRVASYLGSSGGQLSGSQLSGSQLSGSGSSSSHWLAEFLRDVCPSFTVQRGPFPPVGAGEAWTPAEAWFSRSYRLLRTFEYQPREWAQNRLEYSILKYGGHSDYVVYQRLSDAVCARR